jgi:hypothetical protein
MSGNARRRPTRINELQWRIHEEQLRLGDGFTGIDYGAGADTRQIPGPAARGSLHYTARVCGERKPPAPRAPADHTNVSLFSARIFEQLCDRRLRFLAIGAIATFQISYGSATGLSIHHLEPRLGAVGVAALDCR